MRLEHGRGPFPVLRFPAHEAVGNLDVRSTDEPGPIDWHDYLPAMGDVPVPPASELRLRVHRPELLLQSKLPPDGLVDVEFKECPSPEVLRALSRQTALRRLTFHRGELEPAHTAWIACMRQLTALHSWGARLSDEATQPLAALTRLRALDLYACGISDEGLRILSNLPDLRSLDLMTLSITDATLENLRGAARLESLALYGTRVTDAGLRHLDRLRGLRFLGLSGLPMTDQRGSVQVGDREGIDGLGLLLALRGFALGVTRVCFRTGWGNRITDAGLAILGDLASLRRLDLSYTQVTDAGIARLASLKQLRQLDARETRVTRAGLLRLRALRGLEVTWGPVDDFGEAQVSSR